MPLSRKWRSMDFFGSHEALHKGGQHHDKGDQPYDKVDNHHHHHHHHFSLKIPFRLRLSSFGSKDESPSSGPAGKKEGSEPPDPGAGGGLVQRCVIIQKDERGYGFTVSGDNPVHVASVKTDGAAMRAGVQQGDRIVKVNGTLVTSRNHLDVVKLIKSGSYVALTLQGKPHAGGGGGSGVGGGGVPGVSFPNPNIAYSRESGGGRVTAPQPVDPDKDRELWQQKMHMTRAMYETAKEDFEKIQRQYVVKPSEKLHAQLLEKERTAKALENQLKQLTGSAEDSASSPSNLVPISHSNSDSEHGGLDHSNVQSWAASVPAGGSEIGGSSMSDSPHTSPSVSPTPNGQDMEDSMMSSHGGQEIITIDDEDVDSEDDQVNDPGPFADISLLESKPAHMAILLNYLISNSDPSPVLFHIISDAFSRNSGSAKELRKWAYEIYSTFIAQTAPLSVGVEDNVISQIDSILMTSANRTDSESILRTMFQSARQSTQNEISEQLADFRNKNELGMGNFYGFQKLHDNMDRAAEVKIAEELLIPHLESIGLEDNNRTVSDRDQATGWALASFLRPWVGSKSSHSATLDRVQTFMMKDKRSIKFPGSRSSRAKAIKGHQFTLQHFYVSTFCNFCGHLIWGVGYQGYQCQSCEMTLHKQCVEETPEVCGGKQKKRGSKLFPPVMSQNRKVSVQSGGAQPQYTAMDQLNVIGRTAVSSSDARSPPHGAESDSGVPTLPYSKQEDADLATTLSLIAGLPSGHSVKSIVTRYQEMTSPTGPGPGAGALGVPGQVNAQDAASTPNDRRGSSDLSRSGSVNYKEGKSDRPARRAKSDVDVDSDAFKAINQSESSSASSLSKSMESPSESTESVLAQEDPDLDVEPGLLPLKAVLGEEVLRTLKPKEKKRQEVINELFYTERAHLRNLKIIDILFNRPMSAERGAISELAFALFPNMEEMIKLHESLVRDIKERSSSPSRVVAEVGDLLLKRFDGEAGDRFRKGCAEYCRNQAFALDGLKKQTRRDPKLSQLLTEAQSNAMCRRLELKDLVPSQMQRLTKYPLLIDNLLKYTQANSEEHRRLERGLEKCKHILAYVNQAVKECENFHKLKDIQKKLDRKSVEGSTDPALEDVKNLNLTTRKLIFDGPLTWKLRSHRTVDLHALLFEDMLVLLQKQDDKYVLKCQNANAQSARDDHKFTHSPVLRLQNLLARNLATDKKSFFVVNISEVRAQMYEFSAATTELRIRWCNLINSKAEELKESATSTNNPVTRSASAIIPAPQLEQIETERNKIRITRKERSASTPSKGVSPARQVDAVDSIDGLETAELSQDSELIQPEEVNVAHAVTAEAIPVRTPLATVSQGESSASEADTCSSSSSGVSSQPQQPGGPASPTGPAPSGTAPSGPAPSGPAPSGLNVPVPMDQLKAMAQEMNVILSRLMEAITHGSEERHQLRQDLAEAQQKLDLLKDMQRQMTASGAVPPGRLSPRPQDASSPSDSGVDSDIPGIMSALSSTQQQIVRQQEQQSQQRQQQQQQSEGAEKAGELLEAGRGLVGSGSAEEEGKTRKEEEEKKRKEEEEEEGADFVLAPEELRCAEVSPGNEPRPVSSGERFEPGVLQEATVSQLEESVLDLSEQDGSHLLRDLTSVTSVTPASSSSQDQVIEVAAAEEDDDDDDNNEVSVADLPLPDVVSLGAEEEAGRSLTEMLANVELEDSEVDSDDNDTLTSRTSQQDYSGLATTVEDIAGEREEEEQRRRPSNQGEEEEEGEEEDRRTLRGSVDDNDNESLRKNSYPSPVAPGGPNLAMEDVEGEVGSLVFHTDQGAGGDGLDTMSRSSSVDPEKPKIELDCDNTEPIDV